MANENFGASYTTFSGVDMKVVLNGQAVGEMQAVSAQVTREKAGIYTLGSASPRSFSRGKRGIAGSTIFIQFDRDPITNALGEVRFQADSDELRPDSESPGNDSLNFSLRSASGVTPATPIGGGIASSASLEQQESDLESVASDQIVTNAWYADQILPFNMVLAASNEYGDVAKMGILGAEFLNEGWGISIDDLVSEKQATYVAREIVWWQWVQNPNLSQLYPG